MSGLRFSGVTQELTCVPNKFGKTSRFGAVIHVRQYDGDKPSNGLYCRITSGDVY